jgi:hypothetical protein
MGVVLTVRSWARQHNIDYHSEITKDHTWLIVEFEHELTYTLFAVTYKYDHEWHVCM